MGADDPKELVGMRTYTGWVDSNHAGLDGLYGWSPEGGFHNAVWSGALVIDGPCVYLDVSHQDGIPASEGGPLCSLLRLPEPRTLTLLTPTSNAKRRHSRGGRRRVRP